jgi:hypothetical protein
MRQQYLRDYLSFIGFGSSLMAVAKASGAEVGTDYRSADFGKIKIGNTRYEVFGGVTPYVRFIAQMISGQQKSSVTGKVTYPDEGFKAKSRWDILTSFGLSKVAPIPSLVISALKGKTMIGEDVNIPKEVALRFVPMVAQDMYDAVKEHGALGIPMVTPSIFGVGVQTYPSLSKREQLINEIQSERQHKIFKQKEKSKKK